MWVRAVDDFLSYLQLQKRFSPLTASSYSNDLRQFFTYAESEISGFNLGTITYRHIRSYVVTLMDSGYAAVSVNRKLSAIKSFYGYLQRNQLVTDNPALRVQRPRAAKKLPEVIDATHLESLISGDEAATGFEGFRDRLIIDLLYQTGIRRAELITLKEADVDMHYFQLKVLGKRNKERIIPFSQSLARNFSAYLAVKKSEKREHPLLFVSDKNKPLSPQQVHHIVTRMLGRVATNSKKSPHVLRHTFATHMLDNGADIQAVKDLLGHSSLAATQVYTHNSIEKLKKSYKQAHPRSGR